MSLTLDFAKGEGCVHPTQGTPSAADAAQIHELHTRYVQELCKTDYTAEQITGWLKHRTPEGYLPGIERGEMFVAETEAQLIGFGHAVPGEVLAIFVAPE